MFKVIAGGLVAVEACHHSQDPLWGLLKQGPECPKNDAKKLNHFEAHRELYKNVYGGFLKGFYQSNSEVVSDQCFGDWAEPAYTTAWGVKKAMHEDFWSVDLKTAKGAVDGVVDAVFKNAELCEFERVGDDAKHWCLENPEKCMFKSGLEYRMYDNAVELFASFFDLFKLMIVDDSCYTDMEAMAEIRRIMVDIGDISAQVYGFDYKWDKSITRTHIKKTTFFHEMKDLYKSIPHSHMDKLKMRWPDLVEPITEFHKEMHAFVQETKHEIAESFKPHHYKVKSHTKTTEKKTHHQ
jgi:hypothetical protein